MSMLPTVPAATNGMWIVSSVLALVILTIWSESAWRIVCGRHADADGDAHRAGWLRLVLAVLMLEVRWLWPNLITV